jgi:hypothetical protein
MSRVDLEPDTALPAEVTPTDYSFASATVGAHLRRGLLGFVPLALAVVVWPRFGLIALVPAAVGVVALRGCPMCWTVGLIQTVSRQRFRRVCDEQGCRLDLSRSDRDVPARIL